MLTNITLLKILRITKIVNIIMLVVNEGILISSKLFVVSTKMQTFALFSS